MEHTREYLRENLASHERRLGRLPLSIETIIDLEQLGYIVDLRTGEVSPPDGGEAPAGVAATGFLEEGG